MGHIMKVVVKEVDRQGRITIPKSWRDRYLKEPKVVMKIGDGFIEIVPKKEPDLTRFFDSVEVDVECDLSDWHGVRRELRKIG